MNGKKELGVLIKDFNEMRDEWDEAIEATDEWTEIVEKRFDSIEDSIEELDKLFHTLDEMVSENEKMLSGIVDALIDVKILPDDIIIDENNNSPNAEVNINDIAAQTTLV